MYLVIPRYLIVLLYCPLLKQVRAWFKKGQFSLRNYFRADVGMGVCVYVSTPQAIKNYSRKMKSE